MTSEATSGTNDPYTVIVATQPDGRFLMVKHRDRGWELPGGKLESNEGPVHCALREFREETGHLLGTPKFVLKMEKPNGLCYVFTGHLGERVSGMEDDAIQEMEWFERLPEEDLAFPDDPYDEIGQQIGITFR